MRKLLKYIRIGLLCLPRVFFEYFQWILPCSRHPERKSVEYRYRKARSLVVFLLRHMHIDMAEVDIPSLESDRPCVYCANHLSALDPLVLIALSPRPVSFIAKMEAKKIPIAGRFITAIDGLFLDRDDAFQAVRVFKTAKVKMLQNGYSYCIFPEGTRNKNPYDGKVLPFHPGSLKLAYMAKSPIILFAHFGVFHTFDTSKGKGRLLQVQKLKELEYPSFQEIKTVELADLLQEEIANVIPTLVEKDRAYFDAKKNKDKPVKWWKNLPVTK